MWAPSDYSSTGDNQFSFFGSSLSGSLSSEQLNGLGDMPTIGGMPFSSSSTMPSMSTFQMPLVLDPVTGLPLSLAMPSYSSTLDGPTSSIYGSDSRSDSLSLADDFGLKGLSDFKSPFSPTTVPSSISMKSFFSPENPPLSPQNTGGMSIHTMSGSSLLSDLRQEAVEFVPKGNINSIANNNNNNSNFDAISDLRVTAPEFKPKPKGSGSFTPSSSSSISPVFGSSNSTLQPTAVEFKPRGLAGSLSQQNLESSGAVYSELRPNAAEFKSRASQGNFVGVNGGGVTDNGWYGDDSEEAGYSELSPEAAEFIPGRGFIDPNEMYPPMLMRPGLPAAGPFIPQGPPIIGVVKLTCLVQDFDIHYTEDEVKDAVNSILISGKVPRDGLAISSQMLVVSRGEKGYAKVNFPTVAAGDIAANQLNNSELFPGVFIGAKLSTKNLPGGGDIIDLPPASQSIELSPDAPEFVPSIGLVQVNDYGPSALPTAGYSGSSSVRLVQQPSFAPPVPPGSSEQLRATAAVFKPRAALGLNSQQLVGNAPQVNDNSSTNSRGGSTSTEQLRATAAEFKPRSIAK